MLPITLRQLEIFAVVARREHLSDAAVELNLTQSAVSMALAELERQLNGPVFDRIGRRLRINDRGRLLRSEADQLLDRSLDVVARLRGEEGTLSGSVRLGASSTIGIYVLPRIIGTFKERHPAVAIDLEIANSAQIERSVVEHQTDLGFVERPPHASELRSESWMRDRLTVVASPTHRLAGRRSLGMRELITARWILREPGSGTREVFEAAMRKRGWSAESFLVFGHTEAVKQAVAAGFGIGCLSERVIEGEIQRGELVPLKTSALDLKRDFWVIVGSGTYESRLRAAFRAHLEA